MLGHLKDNPRRRTAADVRHERDVLGGWIRQPEVRWLDPSILAKTDVEGAVSGTFGRLGDKRETRRPVPLFQTQEQGVFDYSAEGELWVDYLAATGEGWAATQTMAWLLAQPSLTVEDRVLPRGKILLIGGDLVHPSATLEGYEDRFQGPFAAALPRSELGTSPDLYAMPGDNDAHDGLVSFLGLFTSHTWIGGWRTHQRRSYFALKLPNRWWIWAVDIQPDRRIDGVQLTYFADQGIGPGDKVILLTPKASWVAAVDARVEPLQWRLLSWFERTMIDGTGARLVVTLTGDRHHYARYEPEGVHADVVPTRITAGGGGAYLSATHTLPTRLLLKTPPCWNDAGGYEDLQATVHRRAEIFPSDAESRRLSNGILKLARLNPAFGRAVGAIYALIGVALLGALKISDSGSVTDDVSGNGLLVFLVGSAGGLGIVLPLFGRIYGGTDIRPGLAQYTQGSRLATSLSRVVVALAQTLAHLLAASLVIWATITVVPSIWDTPIAVWLLGVPAVFVAGATIGTTIFACFLLLVHKVRGSKAEANADQVFSGQSIPGYNNLLRMLFGHDGGLTIHPVGVVYANTTWDLVDESPAARFEPRGAAPEVRSIDHTLRFDASGSRIA